MDFSNKEKDSTSRVIGLTVIVALHAFVGYAVVSGLGKKMIDVIKKPVETKIIEEVKPPPPQDLPPPPPPPEVKAPPPPFIPPPEVVVNTPPPPQPAISQTTNVKPVTTELPRTPPPVKNTGDAPVAKPAAVRAQINVAECELPASLAMRNVLVLKVQLESRSWLGPTTESRKQKLTSQAETGI